MSRETEGPLTPSSAGPMEGTGPPHEPAISAINGLLSPALSSNGGEGEDSPRSVQGFNAPTLLGEISPRWGRRDSRAATFQKRAPRQSGRHRKVGDRPLARPTR